MPWFFLLLILLMSGSPAFAQARYDLLTFTQFAGTVESVNTLQNPNSGRIGLHLFARDSYANLHMVHICPQWLADSHAEQFTFKPGDRLIVSGSRFTTRMTKNNILAATIINCSRNYLELRVRNPKTGAALWSNQPDNLLKKVQETQQKWFSARTEAMRQNMKITFSGNAAAGTP